MDTETERDAGFWLRLAAHLVDGLILGVLVGLPLLLAAGAALALRHGGWHAGQPGVALGVALGAAAVAGQWLYCALLERSPRQATFGKQLLGLAVTDAAGGRIGLGRATGRHVAKLLSALPLCLGFLMVAFTARKQALHDRLAGTRVVERRAVGVRAAVAVVAAVVLGSAAVAAAFFAVAVPALRRHQLRTAELAEVPALLGSLARAEQEALARDGAYRALAVPAGVPGEKQRHWSRRDRQEAVELGWPVPMATYASYRVVVAEEGGQQAWAACAEIDLDGDGAFAAWVAWQPVTRPDGTRFAPAAPCAHRPVLSRSLEPDPSDPIGTPVRASPPDVR